MSGGSALPHHFHEANIDMLAVGPRRALRLTVSGYFLLADTARDETWQLRFGGIENIEAVRACCSPALVGRRIDSLHDTDDESARAGHRVFLLSMYDDDASLRIRCRNVTASRVTTAGRDEPLDRYPDWLGRRIIADDFPWARATSAPLPTFLAAYTLHDSSWLGWYLRPNRDAVAVIHWDAYYTNGLVPPTGTVAHWPLLLVRVERLYQLHMNPALGAQGDAAIPILAKTIAVAASTPLSAAEREAMLEYALCQPGRQERLSDYLLDDPLYRTVFQSSGHGQALALHGGETRLLCLDQNGEVLPIPG